ncbi:unnamed protein product [Lymnaea stagnalis]|uniref:HMG box domain-containing protein n=1 Tax=Lymnaea stagnalis TaxID=6523 RepID=A0AAV2HJM9_LYMST
MSEVGNNGAALPPIAMAPQGQTFTMPAQQSTMTMGQSPMNGGQLGGSGDGLDHLAPIFPPQNFEVPDISFSNSVSPHAGYNNGLFAPSQMFGGSNPSYPNVASPTSHIQGNQGAAHMGLQQPASFFPPASSSPPGTSSSDDSDDVPLALLAKRVGAGVANTSGVGSPSGSNTDQQANSPQGTSATSKAKTSKKKKKKKDPNEPQKPVSAYALFFRDTQATIKGHNPNASFGEVSKIVASMWDQLDPEQKDIYKKKTESAKKQYLKQLAAYRANQVSQSGTEDSENSPSPPSMMGNTSPSVVSASSHLGGAGLSQGAGMPSAHIPVTMSSQMMVQPQQQMMQMSPQMMQQQHMSHMQHYQQQQQHQMSMGQQGSTSPPSQPQNSPPQASPPSTLYNNQGHGPTNYQSNMMEHNVYPYPDPAMELEMTYPSCIRNGCGNHARENPSWDSEYCSNDCVISHCRDVFTMWVASRTGNNTFPVK